MQNPQPLTGTTARNIYQKFELGHVVVTDAARSALQWSGETEIPYLFRHQRGDWGDVSPETATDNEIAVQTGVRITSLFTTEWGHQFWIVTDGDRSLTTVMGQHEL